MRKTLRISIVLLLLVTALGSVSAQRAVKGLSANGATGLYSTPTARISYEINNFGIDTGYSFIFAGPGAMAHIPKITFGFLKRGEAGVAFDISTGNPNTFNILAHGKFQFYREGSSAFAIGVNYQALHQGSNVFHHYGQVYLAVTYSGDFFGWPANTTFVIGKTFPSPTSQSLDASIDVSLGFELSLFPDVFKDYIHWINEFSNYSYRAERVHGFDAASRGSFNSGIRIDPLKGTDFKLNFDIVGTDLFDGAPRLMIGMTFGWSPS